MCLKWEEWATWYLYQEKKYGKLVDGRWWLSDERGESIEVKYCPACGSPVDEDGCTNIN